MQSYENPFVVEAAPADARAAFYRKTYGLVAAAFAAWAVTLYGLFATGLAAPIFNTMVKAGQLGWLLVLGLFWLATMAAQRMAFSQTSRATQYAGLALYVVAEAVIFVPLIAVVLHQAGGDVMGILAPAGTVTGLLIFGLSATVFMTRADFSFLKTAVVLGSFAALGAIIVFSVFGITPGAWFAVAMIGLMCAAILWQTHQVKTQFGTDQYVGAATMLFAGFVTLLWYVIQLFMRRR